MSHVGLYDTGFILDASRWMREKDPILPPGTRLDVTLQMILKFVEEYYDQNPLSHFGFIVLELDRTM